MDTCFVFRWHSSNAAFVAVESGGPAVRKSQVGEPMAPPIAAASGGLMIPPERPPKKPHLRAGGGISPDQEMRRIEASAQELINLNQTRSSVAAVPVTNGQMGKRKPPAPDPPVSPPQRPISSSPVSPQVSVRSASPDLPPPPPPPLCTEEVADDPLPPPPPHVVLDDRTQSPPS